jgi:hypothetical protein
MPRTREPAHPDDTDTDGGLAPAVSEHQWRALREWRARGARFPAPVSGARPRRSCGSGAEPRHGRHPTMRREGRRPPALGHDRYVRIRVHPWVDL